MKTIRVVAAVIKAMNEKGEEIIFATQRGYGDLKGGMGISRRKNRRRRNFTGCVAERDYGRIGYGNSRRGIDRYH